MAVLLGDGDGSLEPVVIFDSGGEQGGAVLAADVNGDGKADLVTDVNCKGGDCSKGFLSVLPGTGNGTFETAILFDVGGATPEGISIADINGDGELDAVASVCRNASCTQGVVSVLLHNK